MHSMILQLTDCTSAADAWLSPKSCKETLSSCSTTSCVDILVASLVAVSLGVDYIEIIDRYSIDKQYTQYRD